MRFIVLVLLTALVTAAQADPLPEVTVTNVRRAFHNGEHNAFTDMIRWKEKIWLTFRSCPDGHMVHPTSSILVLSSVDGKDWEEEHRFSVARRDVRDPHFLLFDGKLFIYTGTWWTGDDTLPREDYNINQHLGYAVFSEDGETWSDFREFAFSPLPCHHHASPRERGENLFDLRCPVVHFSDMSPNENVILRTHETS